MWQHRCKHIEQIKCMMLKLSSVCVFRSESNIVHVLSNGSEWFFYSFPCEHTGREELNGGWMAAWAKKKKQFLCLCHLWCDAVKPFFYNSHTHTNIFSFLWKVMTAKTNGISPNQVLWWNSISFFIWFFWHVEFFLCKREFKNPIKIMFLLLSAWHEKKFLLFSQLKYFNHFLKKLWNNSQRLNVYQSHEIFRVKNIFTVLIIS